MPARLTVIKIGGSLLRNHRDIERAAAAVAERRDAGDAVLVVVSALYGVTDHLEKSAQEALDARLNGHHELALESLRERHESIARELNDVALDRVRVPLDEVDGLIAAIRDARAISKPVYARLLSSGERLAIPLLAAAIRDRGHRAFGMTSEEMGLKAVGPRSEGCCDLEASAAGFRKLRSELERQVVVLTGFYGLDNKGEVVLFGRGGSDDTAGAVAAGINADRLELWKDVPGFMTADPRLVKNARVVPELSFDEVAQLGEYGSGIVHHGSLGPLRGKPTEIRICGLGGDDGCGTRLTGNRQPGEARVVALTGRRGRAQFSVDRSNDEDGRLTARVLERLNDTKIPVRTVTTSSTEVCFTVDGAEALRACSSLQDLTEHELTFEEQRPLVAVVGDNVVTRGATAERILDCLADLGLRSVGEVQSAGHAGLSCDVSSKDLTSALNGLHQHFFAG